MHYASLSAAVLSRLDLRDVVALLPIGTLEQHGPHLPLYTDTAIAAGIADAVERLRPQGPGAVVLLPALPYGVSTYPLDPPGGIRVSPRHFEGLVVDIVQGLFALKFPLVFLLNGHGGNISHLTNVLKTVNERHAPAHLCGTTPLYLGGPRGQAALAAAGFPEGIRHADEVETSLMLALHPKEVHPDLAQDDLGRFRTPRYLPYDDGPLKLYLPFSAESREGVYGAPRRASVSAGERLVAEAAAEVLEMIDDMRAIHASLARGS